jgi:DNA-binding NarL/FixJ family response regulator
MFGWRVAVADNCWSTRLPFAPNSFAQIEALQPHALIIDIAIGQEAGWELLEQLAADADTARIPVLVVSTDPRLLAHAEAQAARYGAHRFLAKPLDLEAMLEAIREMIAAAWGAVRGARSMRGERCGTAARPPRGFLMPSIDPDDVLPSDTLGQLRHDLKTPLTTISGQAQCLARAVRHTPLPATTEEEVRITVSLIDALGRHVADGPADPAA